MEPSATAGAPGAHGMQAGAVRPSRLGGLCYGRRASNLPTNNQVIQFYRKKGFSKMLLTPTAADAVLLLRAIKNDESARAYMQIVLCIEYRELSGLATIENAQIWYNDYVAEYQSFITHICVGNVMGTGDCSLSDFKNAMHNIRSLIPKTITLSAMVNVSMLDGAYVWDTHPSSCKFTLANANLLRELFHVNGKQSPLFVRIMPYFMINEKVPVESCLLNSDAKSYFQDGDIPYHQVFDAMLDSICIAYAKVDKLDHVVDVNVVTGWPTAGHKDEATGQNADTYLRNLELRVDSFTPRSNRPAQIYIYSLVNEDKYDGVEEYRHLGIATFNQPQ